jgi:hypothetical protein
MGMSNAAEQDDAINAARAIMASIGQRDFDKLWDETADWYKQKTGLQKPSFMANWAFSRQAFGTLKSSSVIDSASTEHDPSGIQGKFYSVTFQNTYDFGDAYERVVLMQENGKFKLVNFYSAPK